jgi:hypothetical protein
MQNYSVFTKNCFVNGLPNGDLARTIIPNRKLEQGKAIAKK